MTTTADTKRQIIEALDGLSANRLQEVLDFVRRVQQRPRGVPGRELADFFTRYPLTEDEIEKMAQIQEELRQMDHPHER